MIDIVFLLLIFFLVASKMDESAAVRLPPARHGVRCGGRQLDRRDHHQGTGREVCRGSPGRPGIFWPISNNKKMRLLLTWRPD